MNSDSNSGDSVKYTLQTIKSKLNVGRAKPVYCAKVKRGKTYRDEDLVRDIVAASNLDESLVRYVEGLRAQMIENALKSGRPVYVGGVANMATIRGPFETIDGEFDPKRNSIVVASYTYGAFKDCLEGLVPENLSESAKPQIGDIREDGQANLEVIVTGRSVVITGRDMLVDASAADEGVRLLDRTTGECVAVAAIERSELNNIICSFASLPPDGRYILEIATRAGLPREHKVAKASREVLVRKEVA